MSASLVAWQTFLARCIKSRLDPETFTTYLEVLENQAPLPAPRIVNLFLAPRDGSDFAPDPLVLQYVQILLSSGKVNVPTLLRGLWKVSSFRDLVDGGDEAQKEGAEEAVEKKATGRWKSSYTTEETLFYRITKNISTGTAPRDLQETVELISICIQWMDTVLAASQTAHTMLNLSQAHAAEMNAQHMALGTLVIAVVENARVVHALGRRAVPRPMRKKLGKALEGFVPLLLQSNGPAAARLEVFRADTLVALEPIEIKEPKEGAEKDIEDILADGLQLGVDSMVVEEMPVINTRAGLYVYFNSLLVARPLIDDNAIFAYLHNRYQGDIRSTMIGIILAAFDILANAQFRNERASTSILRSFLINKIPLLLSSLSSSLFPPLTPEYCITEALSHVDTNTFPTISNMFDETPSSNIFSDSVRTDFCFACCLHGLIEESNIVELLGDEPMQSLPAGGRYVKDDLIQQCLSDPERAERLIDELQLMDGNVGAASQAIVEVIARLCSNKETMSLKGLCSKLVRIPSSLDVILLFDKPASFLQPICDLLDNWSYDEDQGEYQPVYEEFGSILLLVLSFANRYNLSTVDIGIRNQDSFVARLLNQGHLSRKMEILPETEQTHLDGWIKGLFDNESGGLGDELMSSCPPQDFYLLVPTLFHEIVLGISTKNLSEEALKGGLEYLVDTFLLPALVPGITWLAAHLWESRESSNAVLQILSALITSSTSISNNTEASQMLNSILNIVAKKLEHSLRWLQRAEPSRQDIEPLSKIVRDSLNWERTGAAGHTELESWTAQASGGLAVSVKTTLAGLVLWGMNPTLNSNQANYTHRQILAAVKMLTAQRVLGALIEELKAQTATGNGSVALDAACAIVCAPEAASWESGMQTDIMGASTITPLQRRMTLREALKIAADGTPKMHKTDPFTAETIVRLYRKVEAQMIMPMPQHDALGALGLSTSIEEAVDAMANDALHGDRLGDGMGGGTDLDLGLGMGDANGDLMQGLMGGSGDLGDDLLGFGGSDGMGDGMGF
ncbi:related to Mediator of RNA polymerase II transcription subunit 5 [Rhynchosporium secalis]|uniref:Mediator of RNA polymerase II transcription subunit 5 n=1 Tax=Rhynchosporium secalis TaxID=38038 RepID=A0A1E1MUY9_RHYSE|nr:related to Mediator of RNA polymerase II transcription subunit 5 [Rhynchosporium secalis]